jgi:hypothetical protein
LQPWFIGFATRAKKPAAVLHSGIALILACFLLLAGGCSRLGSGGLQRELTADEAKVALLALLGTDRPKDLSVDTEELSQRPGVFVTEGGLSWGPLYIDLAKKTYSYSVVYGRCTWGYEGQFDLRQGRWVALAPRILYQAKGM